MSQVGNIGDARVLVGELSGACVLATEDHKPLNEGELARIKASGGRVKCGKAGGPIEVKVG